MWARRSSPPQRAVWSLALWSAYVAVLGLVHDIVWPFDLWLGTIGLTGLMGAVLSYLTVALATPVSPAPDN